MGEQRESTEPEAGALQDEVEGHTLADDRDVELDDAVEGHALVDGST